MTQLTSAYALHEALRQPSLAEALPAYIRERRWFGGKSRTIARAQIRDAVPFPASAPLAYLCFVQISYAEGLDDCYLLPLARAEGLQADALREDMPQAVVRSQGDTLGAPAIFDAVYDPAFCQALLDAIGGAARAPGLSLALVAEPTSSFARLRGQGDLAPRISKAEQSNTSIIYGDRLILKLFRRIVAGQNPDLEIGRYLTEQGQFGQIAPVAGAITIEEQGAEPAVLGMLMGFVPNVGDAWGRMLELLGELRGQIGPGQQPPPSGDGAALAPEAERLFAPTLGAARTLGQRTAELHLALAAPTDDPAFAAEPFGADVAAADVAAMHALADRVFANARLWLERQPEADRADVLAILAGEQAIRARFDALASRPLTALRTRAHGDYHLGQVLALPDGDFVIIDFEGEPARSLAERRAKRSPLRDVAGMLRSFDYAAATALTGDAQLESWGRSWYAWVAAAFLGSYLRTVQGAAFMPQQQGEFDVLLDAFLIEKAVYELQYELDNRPDWVRIPAQGILRLVQS
ncbi:hypothetical protein F8S13_04105 [Chloroflexia bacterium SDU3-3]|nr:hypothetical protein F8S13_04105 [Chloroflexia bacterium SDU3-3]